MNCIEVMYYYLGSLYCQIENSVCTFLPETLHSDSDQRFQSSFIYWVVSNGNAESVFEQCEKLSIELPQR